VREPHPVQLAAFDLDETLIRGPTICETLAERLGKLPRMREIEQMRDLAEVHAARDEMLGWYGDGPLYRCGDCTRRGAGVHAPCTARRAHRHCLDYLELRVAWFARRLGAAAWIGTNVTKAGEVQHFWPDDKPVWLAACAAHRGINMSDVAAVGDSSGDVPMLAAVGHPIFVGAALPAEVHHSLHAPNANLRHIADLILAR
jgi:phosphoserine phosphatase